MKNSFDRVRDKDAKPSSWDCRRPHPLIARRTWLWRGDSGEVIEALGFAPGRPAAAPAANTPNEAGRRWLGGIAAGLVHEDTVGARRLYSAGLARVRLRRARPTSCMRLRASPRRR